MSQQIIDLLSECAEKDPEFSDFLTAIAESYTKYDSLTIKQAKVVFWRLKKAKIGYEPALFTIVVREKDADIIKQMKSWQLDSLLPAINQADRDWIKSIRQ